jgi:hypothetical protein
VSLCGRFHLWPSSFITPPPSPLLHMHHPPPPISPVSLLFPLSLRPLLHSPSVPFSTPPALILTQHSTHSMLTRTASSYHPNTTTFTTFAHPCFAHSAASVGSKERFGVGEEMMRLNLGGGVPATQIPCWGLRRAMSGLFGGKINCKSCLVGCGYEIVERWYVGKRRERRGRGIDCISRVVWL